jgi:tetratricopeptide (TPR) repeat protein
VRKKGGKTLPPPKSAIVEGTQSAVDAYRAGDVDGCIGQLEKVRPADKRTAALLARVQDFKGALAQGRADLASRDAADAVGALERALRLDEQIGGGSGKLNGEIRADLGKLHYLFALRWHDSGKDDKAKHELELAIDRDPSHQKAQKLLGELSAGAGSAPEEAPGDDGN